MSDHPEHDKLSTVKEKSQAIGEFLYWLSAKSVIMARHHKHSESCICTNDEWHDPEAEDSVFIGCPDCGGSPRKRRPVCGYMVADGPFGHDELVPIHRTITQWLELYFEIDGNKIEEEKRAMLESIREASKG